MGRNSGILPNIQCLSCILIGCISNGEVNTENIKLLTSAVNDLAAFLRTSGAILGTFSAYSPSNHIILALAMGTYSEIYVNDQQTLLEYGVYDSKQEF